MQPKLYFAADHRIEHDDIDPDALYVLALLHEAGYIAYMVGGGVRDLLMSQTPKDFDISTSARPEEIKRLFRGQCLLIGRRFRLAHIRFGKKILEVSTFRSGDAADKDLIVRDNLWGSPEEDVLRRDFTINGLFYDPVEETVIDYVGGCEDLQSHLLRTIGDPQTRFMQDPVRMIRLLKFRARFGYDIDADAFHALTVCRKSILQSSPARVMEEMFRMLESGAAAPFFLLMLETGLLELLWPQVSAFLSGPSGDQIYALLTAIDSCHIAQKRTLIPRGVLAACLHFPLVEEQMQKTYLDKGISPHMGQVIEIVEGVLNRCEESPFARCSRRIRTEMEFIMTTQYRLIPADTTRPRAAKVTHHEEWPLALEFLRLRSIDHPELKGAYAAWKRVATRPPHHGHHHHPYEKRQHPEALPPEPSS